jgi:stage III sporulation protein AC
VNVDLIFKIAGIGILVAVIHTVLKQAGKEEQGQLVTLAGVIIVLTMVVGLINQLFTTVKEVFKFY